MNDDTINKSSKHIKVVPLLILCIILAVTVGIFYTRSKQPDVGLPKSHVYVCDNPEHFSDFDNWLKEDLQISWVPSYIVIKDGKVISVFDGGIPEEEFSSQLGTALAVDFSFVDLPDYEIENMEGTRQPVNEIFTDGLHILEIHWIDCEDCKYQDDNYTASIYKKYSKDTFYRYYMKSDKSKVIDKYKWNE